MRPGCHPVERRPNIICYNAKCGEHNKTTCICRIGMGACRDKQPQPSAAAKA